MSPWTSSAWRLAHPWAFPVVTGLAVGGILGCPLATVLLLLWVTSGLVRELWWQHRARRNGWRARYVVPAPRRWWRRRLAALGAPPIPPGPLWEMHVLDSQQWPAPDPYAASRAFRAAYTAEMVRWIATRPPAVTLVCTTFNRLTGAEVAAIEAAGGWIGAGAVHPRIARMWQPAMYRRLQRRMFGGVVSRRVRHEAAAWTTWMVPGRPPAELSSCL